MKKYKPRSLSPGQIPAYHEKFPSGFWCRATWLCLFRRPDREASLLAWLLGGIIVLRQSVYLRSPQEVPPIDHPGSRKSGRRTLKIADGSFFPQTSSCEQNKLTSWSPVLRLQAAGDEKILGYRAPASLRWQGAAVSYALAICEWASPVWGPGLGLAALPGARHCPVREHQNCGRALLIWHQ